MSKAAKGAALAPPKPPRDASSNSRALKGGGEAKDGKQGADAKDGKGGGGEAKAGGEKKRAPKGHRQKGAGTVVVSRGEVQRDGLLIEEWQQTPKQLLQLFCKAEKRPPPRYQQAAGAGCLSRVVLPDPKGQSEKDIVITPKDAAFDTVVEAEHAVALLALHRVDGSRSYELKLPEPYRSAWLALCGRAPSASSSSAAAAASSSSSDQFACEECGKAFAKAHGLEHHKKTAHPKAKVKNAQAESAAPAPSVSPQPTPSPPPVQEKQAVKELGTLKASSKFASEAEAQAHFEQKRVEAERAERMRRLRENEDEDFVFMNEENRVQVEAIVREALATKSAKQEKAKAIEDGDLSEDQRRVVHHLVSSMGFAHVDARSAVHATSASKVEEALEWLLVHLDEDRLPAGFDPRTAQMNIKLVSAPAPEAKIDSTTNRELPKTMPPSGASDNDVVEWFRSQLEIGWADGSVHEDNVPNSYLMEWEALQAILGEDASLRESTHTARVILRLDSSARLEIILNKALYPLAAAPLVLYLSPAAHADEAMQVRLSRSLSLKAQSMQGETRLYELWDLVRQSSSPSELLSQLTSSVTGSQSTEVNVEKYEGATEDRATSNRGRSRQQHKPRRELSEVEQRKEVEEHRSTLQKRTHAGKDLPAQRFRSEIVNAVAQSRVSIIKGETGCGKTTQVPQMIFENEILEAGRPCSIIVTQPRRLAATSVAIRVAEEMGESVGGLVGFRVQLESKVSSRTRIEFVTAGLLLRRLQSDPGLGGVTHVVVDEVHERSLDGDFLVALLRESLKANRKLKLVLMSATMDSEKFSAYFGGCPVVSIPGRTFPVRDLHIEDALSSFPLCKNFVRNNEDMAVAVERLESDLDYKFISACVRQHHANLAGDRVDGSILVFVSGVSEISQTIRALEEHSAGELLLLPLHGALTGAEQRRVFDRPPPGRRKVIVSTNVAETSVTIDDVVCVVDTGRMKEMRYDPATKMSSLVDTWVSAASARQRRGRAGRVREGVCLKLFSRERALAPEQLAEVHRVPLEQCVLQVASMDLTLGVAQFFEQLVDPPAREGVEAAMRALSDIGAMDIAPPHALTPLGRHLSRMPMDARLAKMLVFGSLLGVPEGAATIAAALTRRSPFLNVAPEHRDEARAAKKQLGQKGVAAGAQSDHLLLVAAFEAYQACPQAKDKRRFCQENFLAEEAMRETSKLRREFLDALEQAGFDARDEEMVDERLLDASTKRRRLLKASLCAGLYPNVIKIRRPSKRYVETSGGALQAELEHSELRFETLTTGSKTRVFIHPSSINADLGSFNSSWLLYSELVNTSRLFARDATSVAPYGLLLFGGPLTIKHEEGLVQVAGHEAMRFKMHPRVAVLIKELKRLLDQVLADKIANPDSIFVADSKALDACKRLIIGNGFF